MKRIRERIHLPWGQDEMLTLRIPATWRVIAGSDPQTPEPIPDLSGTVRKGLEEPVGSPPLRDLIGPQTRIALVMDDTGRPTPVRRLAPVVLDYLIEAGAKLNNVTGLFAIGAHQPMGFADMEARAGSSVMSRVRCLSIDCHDEQAFVDLGKTQRGTPVVLNKIAVEADLRILIGTIEPHPQASFGGGFKNLLPGLAGAASIGHNHLLMPSPHHYNMVGTLPENNPMRLDLEEAGRFVEGPTFIVNVILDPLLDPVAVVCGDAVAAHRSGVEISRKIYGVEMPHQVDVVISSAYPMDRELRQAGKGVLNMAEACRPGGVIVGFLRCEEGLGDVSLPRIIPPLSPMRLLVKAIGSQGIAFLARHLPGTVPEDRFLVNFALQMLKDYHVLIFSPRLKEAFAGRFPPVLYDDPERLFAEVSRLVGQPDPEVAVFPHGGVSFPIFTAQVENG